MNPCLHPGPRLPRGARVEVEATEDGHEGLQECTRSLPRLAHGRVPGVRVERPCLALGREVGASPESDKHLLERRQASAVSTLQGHDRRLGDLDEDREFALADAAMASQASKPLPERGSGREIASVKLEPE